MHHATGSKFEWHLILFLTIRQINPKVNNHIVGPRPNLQQIDQIIMRQPWWHWNDTAIPLATC